MKKSLKFMLVFLIFFCIIALINNTFAMDLETYKPTKLTIEDDSPYYTIGGTVISIIRTIAAIVCVITLIIAGITMIYGSIEQKAEYKKKLLPIVIGAFFVVGTTSILKVLDRNVNLKEYKEKEQNIQIDETVANLDFNLSDYQVDSFYLDKKIAQLELEAEKYPDGTDRSIDVLIVYLKTIRDNYSEGYVINTIKKGFPADVVLQTLENQLESFYNNPNVFAEVSELKMIQQKLEEYNAYYNLYNDLYSEGISNFQFKGNLYKLDPYGGTKFEIFKQKINGLCEVRNSKEEFTLTREQLYVIYESKDENELEHLSELYYEKRESLPQADKYNWANIYCQVMAEAADLMVSEINEQQEFDYFFE